MLDLETQLSNYGELLEDAADDAERRIVGRAPQPIDLDARRPRRRGLMVAAAVVAVLALVGAGAFFVLQSTGSTSSRSIVANGGPNGVVVDVPLPEGVPTDWKTMEYDGVRVSVPPSWKLLPAGACPGKAETILTGAAGKHCATPKDGAWVWLAPATLATAREQRNCGDSTVGSLPVCLVLPSRGDDPIERALVAGTDSMYVAGSGARTPETPIGNSLRPASGAIPATQPTYYAAAVEFTDAYLTGDCAGIKAWADRKYTDACPKPSPLLGADGSAPHVARSASTQGYDPNDAYVRLYFGDAAAYELRLRHQWSNEEKQGVWKVVSVKSVDPAEAWPTGPIGAPDCVPVSDHSGHTPGCIRRADMFPSGDPHAFDARQSTLTARYGGTPVYASATSQKVVGVMAPSPNGSLGLGFVPKRLVPKIPQLQACADTWLAHAKDQTQPAVDANCRRLLVDYGLQDAQIDRRS